MERAKITLPELKLRFDLAVTEKSLSLSSRRRYQSWIRRYLNYCKEFKLEVDQHGVRLFLQSYKCTQTRRQGYYALKFLFIEVIKTSYYPEFAACIPPQKQRTSKWRKWWKKYGLGSNF